MADMVERRVDPADGSLYTHQEFVDYYESWFTTDEIRDYWQSCQPADQPSGPHRRGILLPETDSTAEHVILVPIPTQMTMEELLCEVERRTGQKFETLSMLSATDSSEPGRATDKVVEVTKETDIIRAELPSSTAASRATVERSPGAPGGAASSSGVAPVLRAPPRAHTREPLRRRRAPP
ncbi:MAG: hypothetical protein GY772_30705 [bacterium]|nr:hypothetical protein [bacterium]